MSAGAAGRGDRLRAEGAGPDHGLPFAGRVVAALVILRFQLPHAALALFYEADRSTITGPSGSSGRSWQGGAPRCPASPDCG